MLIILKRFIVNRDGNKVNYGKYCEIYMCLIFSCMNNIMLFMIIKDDVEKLFREKS